MSGVSWSERTNFGIWNSETAGIMDKFECFYCNLLVIYSWLQCPIWTKLSGSAYIPDIAFGITITIQNITRMIHFKHKEIFYREILRTLSQFLITQLRVTDLTETVGDCFWYTSGLIASLLLCRHFIFKAYTIFKAKIIIFKYKIEKSKLRFFCHDLSRKNNFAQGFVIPVFHMYRINTV